MVGEFMFELPLSASSEALKARPVLSIQLSSIFVPDALKPARFQLVAGKKPSGDELVDRAGLVGKLGARTDDPFASTPNSDGKSP